MARESGQSKRRRAEEVFSRLHAQMPTARIELEYRTPVELLVAVILSAQCTDKRVNQVTPALFRRFPSVAAYAQAGPSELEPLIQSCGLYRTKAKSIVAACRAIVEGHGGEVPTARAKLESLPGVGRKTAGVVCMHLGGDRAFPVDTHILRLARRLGLSEATHPDRVEEDLQALLPSEQWLLGHQLLIWHGRRTCEARKPACSSCVVRELCPQKGVAKPGRSRRQRGRP